jgi:hypothetical protein
LRPFLVDGLGEHGCGCGAVAGDVAGFAGDFADELGAHILIRILEFDLLGDSHAVLGNRRRTEFLVEDDVPAGRPEGGLDGLGEFLDAAQKSVACGLVELKLFSCHCD